MKRLCEICPDYSLIEHKCIRIGICTMLRFFEKEEIEHNSKQYKQEKNRKGENNGI